jgi:ribosomal protein L11 methylase PrmA
MSSTDIHADPSSFRDPAGRVYRIDGRIIRTVSPAGKAAFEAAWKAGIFQKMVSQKRLVASVLLPPDDPVYQAFGPQAASIISHPALPMISYPYEWSFSALKSATLAHLDLHLALLSEGFTLSDASAFNMQFDGAQPLHIDILSITPYRDGMRWGGYRQFLKHFLNPLVLESKTGVSFSSFFRAGLDGVSSEELFRLLPWHHFLRPAFLLHIAIPALGERHSTLGKRASPATLSPLPQKRFIGLLQHLRSVIETLQPCRTSSAWQGYDLTTSYSTSEVFIKQQYVREFTQARRPALLLDVGCNKGSYAALALQSGAGRVIGIDSDRPSINEAFEKSAAQKLAFTPLVVDIANPSPPQGWRAAERQSLTSRLQCDAVIALALTHHLAICQNIPLADVIAFIISLAPRGLIEFIPKSDPQIVELLRLREDIFADYHPETARASILRHANIVAELPVGAGGRIIFEYERRA